MKETSQLLQHAAEVIKHAYAPYSHFHVGACIESTNGKLYTGCNVENASYGLTMCAEASAIAAMIADGETKIGQIAIIIPGPGLAAPCGACRQRINEFATTDTVVHLGNLQGKQVSHKHGELLPLAFGPNDLT